jgi:hypothetical protein
LQHLGQPEQGTFPTLPPVAAAIEAVRARVVRRAAPGMPRTEPPAHARAVPAKLEVVPYSNPRAEERRRTWTGGVARNHEEMDSVSTDFWLAMTPEDRIGCVFEMWDEQTPPQDLDHEASGRLQRATGGVRSRKG